MEGVLQGQPGSLASLPPACLMKRMPVGFIIKELQLTDRGRRSDAEMGDGKMERSLGGGDGYKRSLLSLNGLIRSSNFQLLV